MQLTSQEIAERLARLKGWELTPAHDALRRVFLFKDFAEAWAFMGNVADIAEHMQHHPDWRNVWNRVEIVLSTHDADGITDKDFQLANAINNLT